MAHMDLPEIVSTLRAIGSRAATPAFAHASDDRILSTAMEIRSAVRRIHRAALEACNGVEAYDPSLRRKVTRWNDNDIAANNAAFLRASNDALAAFLHLFGELSHRVFIVVESDPRAAAIGVHIGLDPARPADEQADRRHPDFAFY